MTSLALGHLPSLWRQHLLSEFAGLKQACPEGVFVSLTPGDPSLWSAVLFVRHGPYAPAVLRFQILFPDAYPRAPPLVTFSTDIFHPLITPLTTHMYPTSVENDGSTAERPRLPPEASAWSTAFQSGLVVPNDWQLEAATAAVSEGAHRHQHRLQSEVLDTVPLAAAGNPGAWHAWRTHRRKQRKALDENIKSNRLSRLSILSDLQPKGDASEQGDAIASDARSIASQSTMAREPGEWNWDGVWEDRVKKGVASTLTESVLYGASGISDDMIHFLALEEGTIEAVKGNLRRTLDASA
ncbi:hypothetical protein TrVFT333_001621 [Trichoderma virens FT-333]|nr:hypothetical protein TrVFT333_001621 [Trichoderma virens FT-333]